MAKLIHCRETPNGQRRYRIWSTVVDQYLTESMTEEEVTRFLVGERDLDAIDQGIRERLDRARFAGTSEYGAPKATSITMPWKKELCHGRCRRAGTPCEDCLALSSDGG